MREEPSLLRGLRDAAPAWVLLLLLAALAWLVTLRQMSGMAMVPVTLPLFLAFWVTMMAAMMLPSVAPVAITWARAIGKRSSGPRRVLRTAEFVGGYLLVWAAFGLLAFAGLAGIGRLVAEREAAGRWIGAAAFGVAGLQQLGPLKDVCLRHCRSPLFQLLHYAGYRGWARDLRVGAYHGLYCVGCCWGLMILLVPLGVMNVAAMAGLAAVIFLEKLWRRGPVLASLTGVVFLALAVLAPFQPWLLPGLYPAPGVGMG